MVDIAELVSRRTDLSTFLVHLSRNQDAQSARDGLLSIIRSGRLEARSSFGQAASKLRGDAAGLATQKCVCFTETPLEHVHLLLQDIDGREFRFGPYGLALPKRLGRQLGVNPVWYLDITPALGHNWLTNPLNRIVDAAIAAGNFATSDIARLTPFVEQMGTRRDANGALVYRKEFWWEREWRHSGDLMLPPRFMILCPEAEHAAIQMELGHLANGRPLVDPNWGLEKIIANLAGFQSAEVDQL